MADIAIECKPDEALVKSLGFSKKQITHSANKGDVFRFLEKNSASVGIVDQDPGSANPSYFQKFTLIESKNNIDYYIYKKNNNKLIVIKPRLEEWIIRETKSAGVDIDKFSLPDSAHQLHKVINTKLPKFEDLLSTLISKESIALNYLKHLIEVPISKLE